MTKLSNKGLRRFAQRYLKQHLEEKSNLLRTQGKVKQGQRQWDPEINSGYSFGTRVKNERVWASIIFHLHPSLSPMKTPRLCTKTYIKEDWREECDTKWRRPDARIFSKAMRKLLRRGLASCTHPASIPVTLRKRYLVQLAHVQLTSPSPSVEEQHSHTRQGVSHMYLIFLTRHIRSLCRDKNKNSKEKYLWGKGKAKYRRFQRSKRTVQKGQELGWRMERRKAQSTYSRS